MDADAAQPRLRKISGVTGAAWVADLSFGYLCSRAARAHLPTNSTTADRLGESARRLRVGNSSFRGFYEPNLANETENYADSTGRIYDPDFRVVAASFFSESFYWSDNRGGNRNQVLAQVSL